MSVISLPEREVHHAVPRCLLTLHEQTNGCLPDGEISEAWLEFETEAARWGVPAWIPRAELERLVESSTEVLERNKHRLIHESDWQRWGRRGGRTTLRTYGTHWFSALALKRWGRISAEDLAAVRVIVE